jgi:hypothetical protein
VNFGVSWIWHNLWVTSGVLPCVHMMNGHVP